MDVADEPEDVEMADEPAEKRKTSKKRKSDMDSEVESDKVGFPPPQSYSSSAVSGNVASWLLRAAALVIRFSRLTGIG